MMTMVILMSRKQRIIMMMLLLMLILAMKLLITMPQLLQALVMGKMILVKIAWAHLVG